MNDEQKQKWTDVAVGAAVTIGVAYLAWRLLADGGDVRAFGASGTGFEVAGSILAGVIALLAMLGRKVIAWLGSLLGGWETEGGTHKAIESAPISGTCAALITHLRAGNREAAQSAFDSLAALVGAPPELVEEPDAEK